MLLHHEIELQAARTPNATALRCAGKALTYAELDGYANRCARYLRELGVGPDVIVGVLMERSLEMVVGLLGILKAGGAYLPLDPGYPEARLSFMLADADVPVVVTQADLVGRMDDFGGSVLVLEQENDVLSEYDSSPLPRVNAPDDLAYVIYTSGSTGQPKGCMLSHKAIWNRLDWMQDMYVLTSRDKVLQKTPYTFDVSVWEFFWPLRAGAALIMAKPQGHKDSRYLTETICREGVTVCHFVPSMLRFFLEDPQVAECGSLREVFVSGEALPFELVQRFKELLPARLHNLYGPTEAAVDVSYWECEIRRDRAAPIGRAISNIQLHVLDEARRPVGRGQEGELYIAGVGLARGYLNRRELTDERFVPNPFGEPGSRMYRTGDRVRELPDGNLEFLGRFDFQVKLRGLRIELGEIEATLRDYPGVKEVVVLVRGAEEGDPKLVAYLETTGEAPDVRQVREFVGKRLPDYMAPNIVAVLPRLPVTAHGKLDRGALPWPVASGAQPAAAVEAGQTPAATASATPSLALELQEKELREKVGEHVASILRCSDIAADADLFDLGATSLTLVRLAEWIRQQYGVDVPVDVFLDEPTIRHIVGYMIAQGISASAAAAGQERAEQVDEGQGPGADATDVTDGMTPLPPVRFRASAYLPGTPHEFASKPVEFSALGGWLALLGAEEKDGGHKYLHPSGGGLNAVRTYIAVKSGAVPGLPGAVYYFHPVSHSLHRVGDVDSLSRSAFCEFDQAAFDSAAAAVFFVAALDAIAPIYNQYSGTLVAVEAGYMAQLLVGHQSGYGLETRPVARLDVAAIEGAFALCPGEKFVHCLLVGAAASADRRQPASDRLAALARSTPFAPGGASLNHRELRDAPAQAPLSKELMQQLHDEHRHLRDVAALPEPRQASCRPFSWDDYRLRACRRIYDEAVVSQQSLAGLLSLFRSQTFGDQRRHLFESVTGRRDFHLYLYVRGGRVEGLDEGAYRYDEQGHFLVRCSDLADAAMAQAYSPYNRKHYKSSAFCLFLVAEPCAMLNEEEAIHLPLLDAGYFGQLLMERQAEFGLGLCPIGGMRFDLVRDSLQLDESAVLLHSFTCGAFPQEIPASRQMLVETTCATSVGHPEEGRETSQEDGDGRRARMEAVAIIGLSGRYPGAETVDAYWDNLKAGVCSIAALPPERRSSSAGEPGRETPPGGYLRQIDCFDSLLFGIAPVEARGLDPQERLLLEEVWAAIEDAGYTARDLAGTSRRVGVFVGAMWNDYQSVGVERWRATGKAEEFSHHASLANRISHVFDFTGPSVAVNTSCSSGLTALHMACESIRRGECDAAIVGGVNLLAHQYHVQMLADLGLLSKDGCARPLSAEASGWAPGEGVGAVVVKALRRAESDRDHIHAVIEGGYVGHSGRSSRYGVPNSRRQAEHLRQLLANTGLTADDISYVEAAAPGASLADAAEMNAVNEAFGAARRSSPCFIGTVKGNIGHLESASGFSQLTKVVLQLRHGMLAPALNSEPRNPLINLGDGALSVVTQPTLWPQHGVDGRRRPRHALINSIGAAGSSGHLIIGEYIPQARSVHTGGQQVVVLSAATGDQLRRQVERLRDFLNRRGDVSIADLAFTLRVGRVAMRERLALVVDSTAALYDRLQELLAGSGNAAGVYRGTVDGGRSGARPLASDDPAQLAMAWVQGVAVDWSMQNRSGWRISLPAYPFERVRHWLDPVADAPARSDEVEERTLAFLVRLLAQATGVPASRLGADSALEEVGLNSMIIHDLNARLGKDFGDLPKTLFFEHRTLRTMAAYLMREHRSALLKALGVSEAAAPGILLAPAVGRAAAGRRVAAVRESRDMAIIGLAGRYPQADTLEEFWRNLAQGKDCIEEIPSDRWDHRRYSGDGKSSRWGGFIRNVDAFDPLFFGISPLEAERMDPQERLILETVWRTFEDAGYSRSAIAEAYRSEVGVFIGVMYGEYQLYPTLEHGLGVSGSYGTIANRVSYVLDLHGPSMAVDTMCSSSLTAIHLACESIRRGECACAIAGGVNVSIHPNKYATHALLNMPSSDGRCHSFGEGGDGFVPGEGVGAVLLKPLGQAEADGDHIYGVIKATAVNHGGKTNGYTVPNPQAQANVIARAIGEAGVDPRAISYVEAHGTGTALGDPIEIAGLSKAFGAGPRDGRFCAIGSAKSNIGHCESAAGIAGLTKVLLQLKHGQIVPSLHSQTLNPHIDFERTPFVVQQELAEWRRPEIEVDGERRGYPRIAGISSFGAGGSNAHVIVEEYVAPPRQTVPVATAAAPLLFVLSAKTGERLQEQARLLLEAIGRGEVGEENLADAAYTLQVGREAMEERLALIAGSVEELTGKLRSALAGEVEAEGVIRGQAKRRRDELSVLAGDEDMARAIDAWIAKGKLPKLAELWTRGLAFDWDRLYGERRPKRMSLPTYPFAQERYWLPLASTPAASADVGTAHLHPLVHRNTSDFDGLKYSSRFDGQEFFLADHRIKGRKVLPGVAHLEMARAALAQATGRREGAGARIEDVVWSRPVIVGEQPVDVHVALVADDHGRVSYEIYGEDERGEPVSCSQGRIGAIEMGEAAWLDLVALRAECSREWPAADCYARYAESGLEYGAAHRAITALWLGAGQVLARVELPSAVAGTVERYGLHPSLLDGALQSVIGLLDPESEVRGKSSLPFALEELEILGPCAERMWAVARFGTGSRAADAVRKFDLDLCDDDGRVSVRLRGFSTRTLEGELDRVAKAGAAASEMLAPKALSPETLLLTPEWRPAPTAPGEFPAYGDRLALLCGVPVDAAELGERLGCRCETAPSDYMAQAEMVLAELKAQVKAGEKGPALLQIVVPVSGPQQVSAGLAGLLKSARLENPRLIGQVICVERDEDAEGLAAKLRENGRSPQDAQVRYAGRARQAQGWREPDGREQLIPWRAGDAYLITGGLGGLGRIFAGEIARRAPGARLVLTGRRELDEAGRLFLRELESLGAEAGYRAVDVGDREAVRRLVTEIQEAHEGLNGVLHSAGVIRDSLLTNKSAKSLRRVLAPKVAGLVHLDEASREVDLEWFLCFSSLTAVTGNAGQADYAAGNAYMDAFAVWRNGLVAAGERTGRTVSVNWPLWAEGGMRVDAAAERALEEATGMAPMPTREGVEALYRALAGKREQVAVAWGDAPRMRRTLFDLRAPAAVAISAETTDEAGEASPDLRERTGQYLKKRFAAALRLPLAKVEIDAPLEKYGIDSIMIMNLTAELETVFGSLSKTLFFEHQTLEALAGYFVERHAAQLKSLLGRSHPVAIAASPSVKATGLTPLRLRRGANRNRNVKPAPAREDIAIIGVAGRYPQARDLTAYWENLRNGVDCITEVPKERWDHSRYFDPDKDKVGKTYANWGGFIDGVDEFDPLFFNISPRDAERIDPQERLFLQCAYAALEDAGYAGKAPDQRQGLDSKRAIGVYVGVMYEEYQLYAAEQQLLGAAVTVSNSPASIANRVSYFLNLHGPSMAVDTMCSSSLTAIHLACESLQLGRCELAIAGGVNVSIHPNKYLMLGQGRFASSRGRCESFGEGGDGYVPGEGVGVVILKPLSRAQSDGDHIYGVIRATAINHGGKTNGYTVPNPQAQADVVAQAIKEAGVDPRAISYVEAHGTGTALGDPIEIAGLSKAFGAYAQDRRFCAIGSVKSNIGHCESAAGIAALTKVLLQMKHALLAPSLHSETLNPHIDFDRTPFVVQKELAVWRRPVIEIDGERRQCPRIAGISSFGAGGSNAHMIVEEWAPEKIEGFSAARPALVVLSAKTAERLQERARLLLEAIERGEVNEENLIDAAYTLQVGREAMEERLALISGSVEDLASKLKSVLAGDVEEDGVVRGQAKRRQDELSVLAADEDMARTIDAWIAKGKLHKLAELWAKGLAFDWDRLYGERRPRRISLPTYPFTQERYWVAERLTLSAQPRLQPRQLAAGRNGHFDREFFAKLFRDIDEQLVSVESALAAAHRKI